MTEKATGRGTGPVPAPSTECVSGRQRIASCRAASIKLAAAGCPWLPWNLTFPGAAAEDTVPTWSTTPTPSRDPSRALMKGKRGWVVLEAELRGAASHRPQALMGAPCSTWPRPTQLASRLPGEADTGTILDRRGGRRRALLAGGRLSVASPMHLALGLGPSCHLVTQGSCLQEDPMAPASWQRGPL